MHNDGASQILRVMEWQSQYLHRRWARICLVHNVLGLDETSSAIPTYSFSDRLLQVCLLQPAGFPMGSSAHFPPVCLNRKGLCTLHSMFVP